MLARLALLPKLWFSPLDAMNSLRAQPPFVLGALLAILCSFLYFQFITGELWSLFQAVTLMRTSLPAADEVGETPASLLLSQFFFSLQQTISPIVFLAIIFVPAALFAASVIERRVSFRILLRQEYLPMVACIFYAWAAANLLLLAPATLLFSGEAAEGSVQFIGARFAPLPYFAFLAVIAIKIVLQLTVARAVGAVAIASCSIVAMPFLQHLFFFFSSPFLLLLVILALRGIVSDIMSTQEARERFRQNLEMATLNPADSSAHYNLGLIYQSRGLTEEAKAAFTRAIEIDPDETDAHYQLGRIARREEKLADAIRHFDAVVRHNQDHSQSEVWREIGCAYLQAKQFEDAKTAFERFLERRGSDAEGRYRYGLTLDQLGHPDLAANEMQAVIDSVRTAPSYKYRSEKQWMNEAQSFLRSRKKSNSAGVTQSR